jgi:2,4-dienoyl-CoA reductase-like NADH-dependent reductase (Old Yellow Enzyme family)
MNKSVTPPNPLNQPFTLPNGSVLINRLAKASMSETLGTYDNRPTKRHAKLYGRWASSGPGLILTGNIMIDRRALGEPGNVAIENEDDLPLLRNWAQAVTTHGAAVWAQLNHPGKQATKGLNAYTISASAVPFNKEMAALFETPREAAENEIQDIIQRFGRAAAICKKAGFSGVQIHAAHGYLVNQFLSPHHNQRTDKWGGTPENRRRFLMEIYAEVRKAVGPGFPVGVKLNSADFQKGGFTEADSIEVIKHIARAGVDLIEISGGTYEAPAMSGTLSETKKASTSVREAFFLEFAEKVRANVNVPLMVTGGFRTSAGMNAALMSGAMDIVGAARLFAIDPDAASALLRGENIKHEVRPIKTGLKPIDKLGIMEVLWYTRQLKRMSQGDEPRPNESGLASFMKSLLATGWGTYRTRRLRARS